MTWEKCDRACRGPDGWNGLSVVKINKLAATASMDVTGSSKKSELFDDWDAGWNGEVD